MKTILLLILTCFALSVSAQTKPKTAKDTAKVKYQYFVKLQVQDYQQLANALNEYKRLSIYDAQTTDAQKVQLFKGIEQYLRELPGRVKIDSMKVK